VVEILAFPTNIRLGWLCQAASLPSACVHLSWPSVRSSPEAAWSECSYSLDEVMLPELQPDANVIKCFWM